MLNRHQNNFLRVLPDALRRGGGGFTLIELSIVLVIIGLIVGGILVGRDLIHTAEIRATVAQVEQFNTAVNAFKSKYNCLPGDCIDASNFGFDATTVGNGNSLIGGIISGPFVAEPINFWYHLSAASLIPYAIQPYDVSCCKAGIASPEAKIQPVSRAFNSVYGWAVPPTVRFGPTSGDDIFPSHNFTLSALAVTNQLDQGGYRPSDMQAIDSKIDDGLPQSGIARGWNRMSPFSVNPFINTYYALTGPGGPASPVCLRDDTVPFQYNVQYMDTNFTGFCSIVIKATF